MQVSVETLGTLGRRLTVAVPAEEFEKLFAERLKRLSRQLKLPGFRPGKVPAKIVEQQYGDRLLQEVAGDLIESSFREAVGREGLRPAGGPRIEPKSLKRGEALQYTAEFEIYPELKEVTLAGRKIERPRARIEDADVARTLETIRRQRTRYQAVERAARDGDRLRVDFVGRLHGEPFEGGTANEFPVTIGSGTLLDDLEQGLVGAAGGDTRTIPVKFPADYRHPKLAGQTAEFEIKVKDVAEPVVPELDAALARELGVASGDLDELRKQVRDNLEREAAKRAGTIVRMRVMKALLEAYRVDVPKSLVDAEIAQGKAREASMGTASSVPESERAARARSRVALGLLLAEVMRRENVVSEPSRVRAKLEEMASEYDSPEAYIQWHYAKPGRLSDIESLVAEEQVVESLLKTAEVSEREIGFPEMLQLNESLP